MNSNVFKILIGFLITGIFAGCIKDEINAPSSSPSEYIKYGTSFGMCVGYCFQEVTIADTVVYFAAKSWLDNQNYPAITKSEKNTDNSWNSLLSKINLTEFNNLDTIIGCPDCADGGAEWIEIKKGNIKHKVVFEYNREPEITKGLVGDLRTIKAVFKDDPTFN